MRMLAILATIPPREPVRGLDQGEGKAALLGSPWGVSLDRDAANSWNPRPVCTAATGAGAPRSVDRERAMSPVVWCSIGASVGA
jgi:hypothetical protein